MSDKCTKHLKEDRITRLKTVQNSLACTDALCTILSTCIENFHLLQYVTPRSVTESTLGKLLLPV